MDAPRRGMMLQDETDPGANRGGICKCRVACDELPGLSCRRGTCHDPQVPNRTSSSPKPLSSLQGGAGSGLRLLRFGFGNSLFARGSEAAGGRGAAVRCRAAPGAAEAGAGPGPPSPLSRHRAQASSDSAVGNPYCRTRITLWVTAPRTQPAQWHQFTGKEL